MATILITNDDGVHSPGLVAVAEAVEGLGNLLIAAPRTAQNSMGRAYLKGEDVGKIEGIELSVNGKPQLAYGITGTPAQAVSYAILEIAQEKPILCISGVNFGENVGLNLIPSGTIGAALEADTYDIPSLAISQEVDPNLHSTTDYNPNNWRITKFFIRHFTEKALRLRLPPKVALLNINIPATASIATQIRLTKQSRQNYFVFDRPGKREFSKGYKLSVKVEIDNATLEKDSDIYAIVHDKVVSVTPLTWDQTSNEKISQEYFQPN